MSNIGSANAAAFSNRLNDGSDGNLSGPSDTLETYHPKVPLGELGDAASRSIKKTPTSQSRWLPRFGSAGAAQQKSQHSLRDRLSQKMARISSLDSTRSSSSNEIELSTNDQPNQQGANVMPTISITSNDNGVSDRAQHQETSFRQPNSLAADRNRQVQNANNLNRLRHEHYNNYYGRSRHGLAHDDNDRDQDDDDDDEFDDPPLPIPYSSSSMSRSTIVRQLTAADLLNKKTYQQADNQQNVGYDYDEEDLLDDRQGMNKSEQQFTKGESANRPSLDGSIISELRLDSSGKKNRMDGSTGGTSGAHGDSKSGSSSKKDKQRRSKSPSSSSVTNLRRQRHSRRGFLGLASRFKLTRKHDSIAKLQLSILNSGFVSLKTMDRDLQTFLPKERMTPKEFEERVKLMRKYEVLATIEYRFASRYETYVCRHATQESNQPKNNYKKCIPYDYNRVVLRTLPNVPDSDYINASHVDSYLKPNAYIAAQGPNENTIEDFWRMIWEQKSFVVVMLTKVFDFIRVMCNQYWPVELNKPERYGNLEVTLLYEEPLADFVIRTIKLTKLRGSQLNKSQPNETGEPFAMNGNETNLENKQQNRLTDIESDNYNNQAESGRDYEEDDDEDDYDTSASEELILNEETLNRRDGRNQQSLPPVRSPKYVSRSRRRDRAERSASSISASFPQNRRPSPDHISGDEGVKMGGRLQGSSLNLANTGEGPSRSLSQPADRPRALSQQPPQTPTVPNEFLHPLFTATAIGGGSGSIPSTPNSPMAPRTPSSAGLDRSSATRRAVKKKKRARKKNARPMRTQFQVPSESQLLDDDDDDDEDDYEANLTGGDTAAIDGHQTAGAESANAAKSNERIVYQFHYNSWASHTCPFISSLLHFRRRVRICMDEMSKSGKTGPTIVHCNDGCGRTGTYLCIDANLELAEEDNVYDVFNYTKKMRQSRKFLIENLEQYRFVYDTIEEAMFCGKTWFPVCELHKRLKHKSQRNPITKKNEYQREYEKITRMTSKFSIGDCAGGHRVENREKNRDVSTVPPDNFRPYLTSFQSNDNTDYINAVFVDGYTRSKEYIVTEWPLHKTISDFWSLIYDHDCNSVILLANPGESSTYPSFLPTEKELRRKFGPVFSAEMVSYTHYQNIKSWIYTINKKIVSLTEVIAGVKSEAKTTQVFQITCWPQGHRVPTSTNALVELMNMVERWRQRTAYGPVCVVSLNGKSRAGVYCAANVAIEQVVQHSEVDVFQAVKTVRRHRPQLIENMTEYKYCYDLILHYVLHYVNQSSANT